MTLWSESIVFPVSEWAWANKRRAGIAIKDESEGKEMCEMRERVPGWKCKKIKKK